VTTAEWSQPRAAEHGPAWIAGRARNALRRTALVTSVGGVVFLTALIALVLVPRQATRRARVAVPPPSARPDTLPLANALAQARGELAAAESAYAGARAAVAAVPATPVDTFPPNLVARRDTLALAIASLSRLIARAENAPLPASYRALGQSAELRGQPRVRVLLDSLAAIERERDAFDNLGGVDPIYVALTAQATDVGRAVVGIADAHRAALRRELASLQPPPAPPPPALVGGEEARDTAAAAARVREARRAYGQAVAALRVARTRNAEIDDRLARARELANVVAPPIALLAAALVLGAAVGFGASLLSELRRPRLADAAEAERVTGARVLAVIRAQPPNPERARRRADVDGPDAIEYSADTYRLLYFRFAPANGAIPLLTVTGEDPAITATVAANLAAAAAVEGRSTLLVDGDVRRGAVSRVVHVAPRPGLADILRGRAEWPETIVSTPVGRDGLLDVVPSGMWRGAEPPPRTTEQVRRTLARIAARYDMTVLVAPADHAERAAASVLFMPDVLVCVHVGETPLATLVHDVDRIHAAGERVLGLVLWEGEPPTLPTYEELAAADRSGGARRREAEESGVGL
jgi:tyrosine-protein kinase Etk/Wzc